MHMRHILRNISCRLFSLHFLHKSSLFFVMLYDGVFLSKSEMRRKRRIKQRTGKNIEGMRLAIVWFVPHKAEMQFIVLTASRCAWRDEARASLCLWLDALSKTKIVSLTSFIYTRFALIFLFFRIAATLLYHYLTNSYHVLTVFPQYSSLMHTKFIIDTYACLPSLIKHVNWRLALLDNFRCL